MEQRPVTPKKRTRNYGVDILKMLSMFMVVVLHTQYHGGILQTAKTGLNKHVVTIIEISSYCAVDIFGMVSGYLIVNSKKVNIFKFIPLWLNVFFYTFIITMLYKFVPYFSKYREIQSRQIKEAFFPVFFRTYWYVTAYFCLYMFIPYINIVLHTIGKKRHQHLIILIISVISVIPAVIVGGRTDNFVIQNGYSQWWLGCLYVIGAYFKLYPVKINKLLLLGVYVLSIIIIWLSMTYQNYFHFLEYESFFVLLTGISLFLFFIQVEIKTKFLQKILVLGSSVSFSVYIIHNHPYLLPAYLKGRTAPYNDDPTLSLILRIFLTAIVIYVSCSVIDLFRHYLFEYIYVNKLPGILEGYYNGIIKKFDNSNNKESDNKGITENSESTENLVNKKINNDGVVNMDNTENNDATYQELSVEIITQMDNVSVGSRQKLNSEIASDMYHEEKDSETEIIVDFEHK